MALTPERNPYFLRERRLDIIIGQRGLLPVVSDLEVQVLIGRIHCEGDSYSDDHSDLGMITLNSDTARSRRDGIIIKLSHTPNC